MSGPGGNAYERRARRFLERLAHRPNASDESELETLLNEAHNDGIARGLMRAEVIVRGWCDHADAAADAIAKERTGE